MLPLFLLSSIVYQFLHAIQMLFIQLVGAYENGTDEGLNQSVDQNNTCNDYCEISAKNRENSINQWLHKSGILDLYKSRPHCMDIILLLQPETQVTIPVKRHRVISMTKIFILLSVGLFPILEASYWLIEW